MKTQSPFNILERINPRTFFLISFLYQLLFTFQGVDLSDAGFYGVFYQQIFRNPETVQHNFVFWFSGIVGGSISYLFPFLGMWGFRIAGVLVTTGTLIITYHLLKDYINRGYLKLALFMVLLYINNNLKEVHYNDLSALLNMGVIYFLFRGLREQDLRKIFLSGLFIAISTFTRLPNVLCLGLGLAIFYWGFGRHIPFAKQVRQALVFAGGFLFMSGLILLCMKLAGHLDIFINSIKLLLSMGKGGEESFYGPAALLKNFLGAYFASIKYLVYVAAGAIALVLLSNAAAKLPFYRKWISDLARYLLVLGMCAMAVMGILSRDIIMYFFTGLSLVAALLVVAGRTKPELKLLSLMGCFILLTYPFSSSAGLFTVGIYSVWLSFPVALDYIARIRSAEFGIRFPGSAALKAFARKISDRQWTRVVNATIIVCIFSCFVYTWRYPFFDRHDRFRMTSTIDSKYLKGILTTPERAAALNELFQETGKYVRPGDYLIAYQCIPLLNYVTSARPYVRSSYPWLYEAGTFGTLLNEGLTDTGVLPVVVVQKIKTIGASSNWPDPTTEDISGYLRKNARRDSIMNEFLQVHQYREVWSSAFFRIYVPPMVAGR